ncbi:retrovirus-related pol polyprotein from transposon RE1 [Tanacetum coccineum]
MEMARSMLYEKKLPKTFWAEAVATSVYLLDRLATKVVSGKTPIEAWSGIKLSIQHLKVFGFISYYHIPNIKRSKLDAKARKGIFVGHTTESKGYRIYDLTHSKIHDEVDVPEFEDEDTTDTDVLRTRPLIDVYESCNSVIKLESYVDASKHSEWIDAMKSEIEMIKKNNTSKLVDLQKGKNAIDFGDTFAPVAHHDTIKLLLAIAAQQNWKIHHLDVQSAFMNGELEEDFYVKQLEGFEVVCQEEKVYRLYKALYGLKQAPKACNLERLIISLYVDDLLVIGSNDRLVKEFKKQMESEFDMSDMGLVSYFLGMEIKQLPNGVHISQRKYASDMLKKFKMFLCKPVTSPLVYKCKLSKDDRKKVINPTRFRSIVRSLLYLTISRPDLAFAASFLSRFMGEPSSSHLGAAKRVLRYVKGSLDLGIMFERKKVVKLEGYADGDWAGSIDDSKSISGYIFTLGPGVFCWNSKKQSVVAQSSAEAEYIPVAGAVNHAIWIRKLLFDLNLTQEGPTMIFCDNKSAIAIAENPVQHGRTKHINVKYHAIREAEKNEEVKLKYCTSETQLADMLTKSITGKKLNYFKAQIMKSNNNLKEEC